MNILTFDIEEWYTYELYPKGGKDYYLPVINQYLDNILDLLDEIDTKATFFCLGIIARTYPEIIKKIDNRGHEIGCHSDKHILLTKMTAAEFKADTHAAVKDIEKLIGKKVQYYRAPAFSITENNKWAFDVLIEEGITTDCSIFPSTRSYGGFPSFKDGKPAVIQVNGKSIQEFPVSYVTWLGKRWMFSGGGYFRFFPYSKIKKMMGQDKYNMAYFHIRDFDSKQKQVYSMRYFHSYYGIKNAYVKLEQYLKEFQFISLGQAISNTDWNAVTRVNFEFSEHMYNAFIKPGIDFIVSFFCLLLFSPVLIIIIVLLLLINRGKVFFFQQRSGKEDEIFWVIKFKTMNDRKDMKGKLLPDKERLTPVGKFIRTTSLDELPQIINVLRGHMSLVGPRPLLPKYLPLYSDEQKRRHDVKPGITGWAQVNGRNAISWQQKFEYDVWYVDHLSFLLDLRIIFLTLKKVLIREGISGGDSATMKPFTGNN